MPEDTFDIQQLVKISGVPRRTIYFYVQQGLLPPPEGAGLAAYYTDQHLARLRLIPVFRQRGLRLDDIRRKFEQMTPAELQSTATAAEIAAPAPPQVAKRVGEAQPGIFPRMDGALAKPAAPSQAYAQDRSDGKCFIHYALAGEISLVAPADLTENQQEQVNRLLRAAAEIFAPPDVQSTSDERA